MLVYKDQTFCTAYPQSCVNEECPYALTPELEEKAQEWWDAIDASVDSVGPPIALSDRSQGCSIIIRPKGVTDER